MRPSVSGGNGCLVHGSGVQRYIPVAHAESLPFSHHRCGLWFWLLQGLRAPGNSLIDHYIFSRHCCAVKRFEPKLWSIDRI